MAEKDSKDAETGAESTEVDLTGQTGDGTAVEKVGEPAEPVEPAERAGGKHELVSAPSRTGLLWTALAIAGVVLVFLLIFVAQNFLSVTVHFLGLQFSLPLGLALLFAAIIGGVLVWLAGTARMIQMRRAAKKARQQS